MTRNILCIIWISLVLRCTDVAKTGLIIDFQIILFKYSEKATKIWKKISHLVLTLLSGRFFFQILWPSHTIWTLKWTENWKNSPWFTIPWNSKSSHECRLDYIAFPCDTFRREFRNENDWYSHRKVGFSRRTHTQWFHFLGFIAVGWRHLCFYAFLMIENIMTKISVI